MCWKNDIDCDCPEENPIKCKTDNELSCVKKDIECDCLKEK